VLLLGLVEQTLAHVADRPATAVARELGIRPVLEGSACGVPVWPITCGRAKAVLFEIQGDFFLYAMTSAARTNEAGENDWTVLLGAVVEALRPEIVQVATLSRLVRSLQHSSLVLHSMSRHVDEVRAGNTVMRLRGEGQEAGQIMWTMLSMVAASERNLIVQRLTAGTVAKYRRGEWILGRASVPLGYALDAAGRLVVDPAQAPALRQAFAWMADPHLAGWEIVRRLGDLGVTAPHTEQRHGPGSTVADHTSPEAYIDQLTRWSGLYLTGTHVTYRLNPFEGAQHIAGMPVIREGGRERLRFEYEIGRPDVDLAIIEAGLEGRRQRSAGAAERGGASHDRVPAVTQTAWIQDGFEYWMVPGARETYELRVRAEEGPSR